MFKQSLNPKFGGKSAFPAWSRGVLAIAIALLAHSRATAQVATADIVGTVTDNSGSVVAGAKISATNLSTNLAYSAASNVDGNFILTQLPAGRYKLDAEQVGFKSWQLSNVSLAIGDRYRADVKLEIGQLNQTIVVQAEEAHLQTESATVGSLIDERQVQDLPLLGRNFVTLTQLVPGATDYDTGSFSTGDAIDDRRRSSSVSVNGFLATQNNFMIDGMDNNERFIGTVTVKPSIEAIGEIKVITNTFSAELSRANGAGISFITKGGTNTLHGSVFEFFRNQALDARPPLLPPTDPKAPYRQNNIGGSVGGPIKKNKTFFFYDWESYLSNQATVNQLTVPLISERQGNFNTPGLTAAPGIAPIYDPLTRVAVPTSQSPSGFTRSPFPNNQIPLARFDPAALNILNLYPDPQFPNFVQNNYYSAPARVQNDNTMDARIDHRFSEMDNFYVRYSWNHTNTTTPHKLPTAPNGIDPIGNGGGFTDQQNQNIQLNNVYTLKTAIIVLQGSYSRWALASLQTNYGKDVATQLGVPGVNIDADSSGMPGITLSTAQNIISLNEGTYQPTQNFNNTFQENASLQASRGAHSIKTGVNLIRRQVNAAQSSDSRGTFSFNTGFTSDTFNTNTTGNGLASFILGDYSQISRSKYLIHPGYRFFESGIYFQDDWRATKWLTLNMGVRWDYYSPLSEEHGRIPNWNWAKLGLSAPGEDGMGNTAGVRKDWRDIAPRFGFAAQVNRKTVLRGGFGINYAPDIQGTPGAFRNAPYNYSVAVNPAIAASDPTGTLSQGMPAIIPPSATNPTGPIVGVSADYVTPRTYQYNLTVQRSLPFDLVLNTGFVGNLGRELGGSNSSYQFDGVAPGSAPVSQRYVYASVLPKITGIALVTNYYNSSYSSLQTSLTRRFSHGISVVVNHTWSKTLDNGTLRYLAADHPTLIKGASGSDRRQRVSITMNSNLPFAAHSTRWYARIVHQWKLNVIGAIQSGAPLSIASGANINGATGPNYPNVIGDPNGPGTYTQWFNTAAFQSQPAFTWGNAGRVIGYGPGKWNFDTSLQRELKPLERFTVQFRLESFNLTNTQTPGNPDTSMTSTTFGRITTISGSRRQQLGLKILF